MPLFWISVVFFALWILEWIFKGVNSGFWLLLGVAVAFMIVHFWVRATARSRAA